MMSIYILQTILPLALILEAVPGTMLPPSPVPRPSDR